MGDISAPIIYELDYSSEGMKDFDSKVQETCR